MDILLLMGKMGLFLKRNNMYLFIDTLSDPTYIALFDKERKIIDTQTWRGKQHEFDTLTEEIDALMSKNSVSYKNLSGIVVMV